MTSSDEPIDDAVLNLAQAAQQLLVVSEALSPIHGAEVVCTALLVTFSVFAERALGQAGMVAELNDKIAKLLGHPTVEDAIKWLH